MAVCYAVDRANHSETKRPLVAHRQGMTRLPASNTGRVVSTSDVSGCALAAI